MGSAIGDILAPAIGVAISPVPIIAVILMLFTERARTNSLAFLLGWVLGLVIVGAIVLALADPYSFSPGSEPSTAASAIRVALALLFFALAFRELRKRPAEGEEPGMPGWMSAIDSFTPPKALGIAAVLSGINPKNLALTLSAALAIAQAGLSGAAKAVPFAVFAVIASLSVAAPVAIYFVLGDRASRILQGWKTWLSRNNAVVMAVLFVVFGFVLLGNGISGLTG